MTYVRDDEPEDRLWLLWTALLYGLRDRAPLRDLTGRAKRRATTR